MRSESERITVKFNNTVVTVVHCSGIANYCEEPNVGMFELCGFSQLNGAHTEVKSFNKRSRHSTANFSHGRHDARIIRGYVAKLRHDTLNWLGKFPAESEVEMSSSYFASVSRKLKSCRLLFASRTNECTLIRRDKKTLQAKRRMTAVH